MGKREELVKIKQQMKADKTLPLREGAHELVFGEGTADTKIMFIGEGPGYWEDMKGRPFVGRAGQLLDENLEKIGLSRNKVFITNVVHFRPPENRDPSPDEIEAFGKYLDQMIKTIKPEIVVTLGRFSMGKFLPDVRISQIHGQTQQVNWEGMSFIVIPMYHPAAALRNGAIKTEFEKDFQNIKNYLVK